MKFKKLKLFFKKLLNIFVRYPLIVSLFLIIFVILLIGKEVYFYFQKQPQIGIIQDEKIVAIDFKIYQEIINEWSFRQQRLERAPFRKYLDPFFEKVKEIQEPVPLIDFPKLTDPKQPLDIEKVNLLKQTITLFEFFLTKEDALPSIKERAKIWEEKGMGPAYEYQGFYGQNIKLLEELKKGLTE